jgi:hypothetical protein
MTIEYIHDLTEVLKAQLDLYRQVNSLLDEEHAALMSHNPDDVLELVHRKETMLLRIRTLEETRQIITSRLAKAWSVDADKLRLSEIAERIENTNARNALSWVREGLREVMQSISDQHRRNAAVCQSGMQLISDIVQAAAKENATSKEGGHPSKSAKSSAYGNAQKSGRPLSNYRTTT